MIYIPLTEFHFTFVRSSGAGGQNVNKTATKAVGRWSVGKSRVFTEREKARIRVKLANKLNNQDEIVVTSEEERSQAQNRELAITRLQWLISRALLIPKKRRPTRPTWSSKLKRLASKRKRAELKKARQSLVE